MEKVDGPLTSLPFLGLILDSTQQEIRLPPEKLQELMHELNKWQHRKKAAKRELLSLIEKLSFAVKAVPVGRLFLHRLITQASSITRLHHHIRLNSDAQADITWWQTFMPSWNGTAKFIDPTALIPRA